MKKTDPADPRKFDLLILGLGNVLCADDGVGVVAVEQILAEYELPDGVQVLDGGTLGLSLLGYATDTRTLVLVDAIQTDEAPGSLVRMEGDEVAPAVRERLSVHQIGVTDLLDSMHLIDRYPPRLLLIGVVPESLELRASLSPSVEDSLDQLVQATVELCAELGHPLIDRNLIDRRASGRTAPEGKVTTSHVEPLLQRQMGGTLEATPALGLDRLAGERLY